jgi:hypothetical protein
MSLAVVLGLLSVLPAHAAPSSESGSDTAYPTYNAICDSLEILSMLYPTICNYVTVGTTYGGREIMALVISDDVMNEGIEPEILLVGCVHGDEKASAMTVLQYAEWLAEHYASDPNAQYIVGTAELWVIPVLNPDGYVNNTMTNGRGVDPNRNFETYWSIGGSGSAPFSEEESQAIRDLTFPNWPSALNPHNPFAAALSFHSGDSYFVYVWSGSTGSVWDNDLILDTADEYDLLNLDPNMTVTNGWNWYPTYGEMSDWCYDIVGTIHSHLGVCLSDQPADWQTVANNHTNALNNFCRDATYGIWGTVENASGTPLSGIVYIARHDGGTTEMLNYCRCDMQQWGDYAKMLLPGVYDVHAVVAGYTQQTVYNVNVSANQRVEVSFTLYPLGIEEGAAGSDLFLATSPNPFTGTLQVQVQTGEAGGMLSVHDITGRSVYSCAIEPGGTSLSWVACDGNGSSLPTGVYVLRLDTAGGSVSRMVVLRR